MINGVRFKVCGLTSLVDAEFADACGADYLGFIFYSKSPRYISLETYRSMEPRLPPRKKVAVTVSPSLEELTRLADTGFDYVQLHFPNDTAFLGAALWSEIIPADRLWMAPRAEPPKELDPAFFPLAETFLFDGYSSGAFGGTGKTSNWEEFRRLRLKYTRINWILAGGLNAENIGRAVATTGTSMVDVNSGVEATPGVKDHAKLKQFVTALHVATVKNNPAYSNSPEPIPPNEQ